MLEDSVAEDLSHMRMPHPAYLWVFNKEKTIQEYSDLLTLNL